MRILQLNNYADPIGGAEVYALALTRELRQRGHVVAFLGTAPDREVDEEHLRVVRRPRYDPLLLSRDPSVRAALADCVRRVRPEVIHVHNVYSLGVDVLELLGATRVPVVQTVHDFNLLCPNSWCVLPDGTACPGGVGAKCFQHDCQKNYPYDAEVALFTLLRQRALASTVDLALCPSRHLTDLTRKSGARDVRHLNYFIDPIAGGQIGERKERELVYIGRLEPEKGVEHLLEAMVLILRSAPSVHLTIVGGGALAGALTAQAEKLHLQDAVTFLSHVPRDELGRFYATASGCVLPSIWSENSPLVAHECLAAGLPMIASRIGGIPELVEEGQGGFTFNPRDARDLAEKALRLLALPAEERARMSAAMQKRALDFRAEPHVARIEELYREVIRAGPGARDPSVHIDADLLAVLEKAGRERAQLTGLFHEHVDYIRNLERGLVEQRDGRVREVEELGRALTEQRERVLALENQGPAKLLRRLVRALLRG